MFLGSIEKTATWNVNLESLFLTCNTCSIAFNVGSCSRSSIVFKFKYVFVRLFQWGLTQMKKMIPTLLYGV